MEVKNLTYSKTALFKAALKAGQTLCKHPLFRTGLKLTLAG
jgi:hypothetical protein